jgi:uncharacterized repeat protein (TIGR01451 family)
MVKKLAVALILGLGILVVSRLAIIPAAAQTGGELSAQALPILAGYNYQLSADGGRLPEIVANDSFVAVAYQLSDVIYLQSAVEEIGWTLPTAVGEGRAPRLALSTQNSSLVHIVWQAADGTAIRYTTCTLNLTNAPSCGAVVTLRSGTNLSLPDVVIDASGNAHAAWINDETVETAKSTNWNSRQTISSLSEKPNKLALATANGFLHLAFVDENGVALNYYRSPISTHSWTALKSYEAGGMLTGFLGYKAVDNPTIATNGTTVYITFDALTAEEVTSDKATHNGLLRVISENNGETWSTLGQHITSTNPTSNGPIGVGDKKLSRAEGVPAEINGLRPSLTANTATGGFEVVWQQRPANPPDCSLLNDDNGTSEIYHAYTQTAWIDLAQVEDDRTLYSFDPDIAVTPSGQRHIVFVQGPADIECDLKDQTSFSIYYLGPIEPPPDEVTISKVAPATFAPNEEITYTLVAINNSSQTATNVVIKDTLPEGATYIRGGTLVNNTVQWNISSLAGNGGWVTVYFVVTATARITNTNYEMTYTVPNTGGGGGTTTKTVPSTKNDPPPVVTEPITDTDPITGGNGGGGYQGPVSMTAVIAAIPRGDTTAQFGDTIAHELIIFNVGPAVAKSLVASDTLAGDFELRSVTNGGQVSGNTVTWNNLGDLAVGSSITLTLELEPRQPNGIIAVQYQVAGTNTAIITKSYRTEMGPAIVYLPLIQK